eukprot:3668313-Pyramimonas_sp.AAC.1
MSVTYGIIVIDETTTTGMVSTTAIAMRIDTAAQAGTVVVMALHGYAPALQGVRATTFSGYVKSSRRSIP